MRILVLIPALLAAAPAFAQGEDRHRTLIVAAPGPDDPALAAQRRYLKAWNKGAHDRDVVAVEIIGTATTGAGARNAALRREHKLASDRFAVLLIGKDGNEALRSAKPLDGATLQRTIDAMPMRRAGLR